MGAGRLEYHRTAHGFVCGECGPASGPVLPATTRSLYARIFQSPPQALAGPDPDVRSLEAFHRELITSHLERDLRSPRVIREATREAAS